MVTYFSKLTYKNKGLLSSLDFLIFLLEVDSVWFLNNILKHGQITPKKKIKKIVVCAHPPPVGHVPLIVSISLAQQPTAVWTDNLKLKILLCIYIRSVCLKHMRHAHV